MKTWYTKLFRNIMLLSVFIFAGINTSAQINYQWSNSAGSTGRDYAYAIALDDTGNVYVAGIFAGTVDFDPSVASTALTAIGGDDAYFAKYDKLGNFVWAKSIGSIGYDEALYITLDEHNNILLTGDFSNTADFNTGSGIDNFTSFGSQDIFLAKYDNSGNYLWNKQIGGNADDQCYYISIDKNGSLFLSGYFSSTADFDPSATSYNLNSNGFFDIFLSKYDSSGNMLWAKGTGGTGIDLGRNVAFDTFGNIYLAGSFSDTTDFDPSASTAQFISNGNDDIFFSKYDASGNFLWAKTMGGTGIDRALSMGLDAAGNIYVNGMFQNTVDFDPGAATSSLSSVGLWDIFLEKFDNSGNKIWLHHFGSTGDDQATCIQVTPAGNIFAAGVFSDTIDFDPSTIAGQMISKGLKDIYVTKYNSSGAYLYGFGVGGAENDEARFLRVYASGNIYVAGGFRTTVDFDPDAPVHNESANGDYDIFVAKYINCANLNNGTTLSGFTISAVASGISYQWLDCNHSYEVIPGETYQNFTPSVNGSYAVAISNGTCSDTSACVLINNLGLSNKDVSSVVPPIYPVPSDGKIIVHTEQASETYVLDILGNLVYHGALQNEKNEIDLSHLRKGLYFIYLKNDKSNTSYKIILE